MSDKPLPAVLDIKAATDDAMCRFIHEDDNGSSYSLAAKVRLYLIAVSGLRYIDVCAEHAELANFDLDEIAESSTAVDPGQQRLEAEAESVINTAVYESLVRIPARGDDA